jgi:hypothetical protein
VANSGPQGWAPDPFGLHEARYFSAGQPTKLVRDGRVESFDEPPSHPGPGPGDLAAGAREVAPAASPSPAAPTAAPAGFTPASKGLWPAPPDNAVRYGPFGRARVRLRRPWDGGAWAAIGILAAAALVIGVVLAETPTTKPGTTLNTGPAASLGVVSTAAQATMALRTADVTLSGTIEAQGQAAVIRGTGVFGLNGDVGTVNSTYSLHGTVVAEKEILVGGSVYVSVSVNGKNEVPGGKTWIQMSPPQVRASAPDLTLGVNPSSVLSGLEARGDSVQALGTKLIDGRVCSGYGISGGVQTLVPMTITIWVDLQHLVREMTMSMTVNVGGMVQAANMTMDFTSFGGPVQVTAPAPASVISYAAYTQAVGHGNVS